MKTQTIKFIILAIAFLFVQTTARAASHLNLPSDLSEFRSEARFMKVCVELNEEVGGKEDLCSAAWTLYSSN